MVQNVYEPPTLTVDGVILQIIDNSLQVLLIRRSNNPMKNSLALPGGYNAKGQTTMEAFMRILERKAGIAARQIELIEQLYTFDTVSRDPRGHAVSVTYLGLGNGLVVNSTTENPEFYPVDNLPQVAFDHKQIIDLAIERLISKISYTNVVYSLLPKKFTLSQLQKTYEIILGRELDKRNFRKKFNSFNVIENSGEYYREGAHRPAKLYQFKIRKLEILSEQFS